MSTYRVLSPILHDQVRYEPDHLIDGDLLSEGQAEALLGVRVLELVEEPVEDSAPEASETVESAEPAPADSLPAAEPVSAPQPTESAESAEEEESAEEPEIEPETEA